MRGTSCVGSAGIFPIGSNRGVPSTAGVGGADGGRVGSKWSEKRELPADGRRGFVVAGPLREPCEFVLAMLVVLGRRRTGSSGMICGDEERELGRELLFWPFFFKMTNCGSSARGTALRTTGARWVSAAGSGVTENGA